MKRWTLFFAVALLGMFAQGCFREVHITAAKAVNLSELREYWWVYLIALAVLFLVILGIRKSQKGGETNLQRYSLALGFYGLIVLAAWYVNYLATPQYMAEIRGWRGPTVSTQINVPNVRSSAEAPYMSAEGDTVYMTAEGVIYPNTDVVPAGVDARRVIRTRTVNDKAVLAHKVEQEIKKGWFARNWEKIWGVKSPQKDLKAKSVEKVEKKDKRRIPLVGEIIVKLILIAAIGIWVYWRIKQAEKEGQWLVTINPKTKKPDKFKVLLFENQTLLFLVFHSLLALGVIFSELMFKTGVVLTLVLIAVWMIIHYAALRRIGEEQIRFWIRIAVTAFFLTVALSFWGVLLALVLTGLFLLSTYIKLRAAEKLVWEWMGADVYGPRFYLWSREDGEDTAYRGKFLVIGDYRRGFRKGTHTALISCWIPSNFVRAYFYPEEVLEIDTFACRPYATVKTEWPDTNRFDGSKPDDLKNMGESGPEVVARINLSVYKYLEPRPYITMSDEDRKDEQNFVKRRIVEPAVSRFLGRMTLDQAVVAKLLRSKNVRFMMDGEEVTFSEYINDRLEPYGWAVKNEVEIEDCDQPEAVKKAQEALKVAETAIQAAMKKATELSELAKGEGLKLLHTLEPLSRALGGDPAALREAMVYYKELTLYGGTNRFFALVPKDLVGTVARALPALGVGNVIPPEPTT